MIEVVASRYTRVATLDADAAAQLAQVWVGLFGLVIEELLGSDAEIDVALLGELHERAADDVDDPRRFVDATDRFYDHLVSCSRNLHLVRAIGAVAHALGVALANLLDSERLPEFLHMQAQFLEAVRTRDAGLGRASMTALRASADGR